MSLDRIGAVAYARRYWNRVCDDDKLWITSGVISLAEKRRALRAPASEAWDAFFVSNGDGGENAVFRRTVNGSIEEKPDPIAEWDHLDDCTHYVCRCLIKEGVKLTETPRANELTEAMLKSSKTKVLAIKATRKQGQRVIDTGVFKPGDLVGYYTEKRARYTHTAMFVGNQTGLEGDPGGITCHTVCRFEGQTQAWNGASDDAWFLHEGLSYTLIHFSEDDVALSAGVRQSVTGWWKVGSGFYFVADNGHAFATPHMPANATQRLSVGTSVGYYFESGRDVMFIWRKPGGNVQVERWTASPGADDVKLVVNGLPATASRVAFKR